MLESRSSSPDTRDPIDPTSADRRRRWRRFGTPAVFAFALAVLIPTAGDYGVTWDEPAYRYSQTLSAQWWRQWLDVRSWEGVERQVDRDALLYYWPYGRYGINFHPPLAGQVSLAAHAVTGNWMKDFPSRRMGSILCFALTLTIGCHFLSRRYGAGVGLVAAGSLLLMPRVHGQAHLLDTDIPGLLIWASTAIAFWNGLHEPRGRSWRVLVGVLLGLAFLEKMAAVGVMLPLFAWLATYIPSAFSRKAAKAAWIDAAVTLGLMLAPLGMAFVEIQLLQRQLPPAHKTDLFFQANPRPPVAMPGLILAAPLAVWVLRRGLARWKPASPTWGVDRPALETVAAILAFAPLVGWLGNPAWWRETIVRLAHYYTISNNRQGALPDILILYMGQIYKYSLPWHNGWVLTAITVPPTILVAGVVGIAWGVRRFGTDRLPTYFLVHMATLPALRMLHTPAHDGVRLLLPTFFFLSAFAGWGASWIGVGLGRRIRWAQIVVAAAVLTPALVSLARIHPYELSYYNILVGGPSGAWHRGYEMTYWYDAFTPAVIDDLNRLLPKGAEIDVLNLKTDASMQVFTDQQNLGHIRPDIKLQRRSERFPYVYLLTQDSKATAFTRLLFAMKPWYASEPRQVDGLRILTVADPVAVSRAWALSRLLDSAASVRPAPARAPDWVRSYAPMLKRLWGEGLQPDDPLGVNERILSWAAQDPEGLKAASRRLADQKKPGDDPGARRLFDLIAPDAAEDPSSTRLNLLNQVLQARPEALVEAVEILVAHPDAAAAVITRYAYTDPATVGGYLDRDLADVRAAAP